MGKTALKKLLTASILFFLILSLTEKPVLAKPIDEIRQSVVRILCYGSEGTYIGTGFAVGKEEPVRHIVTNYHVVQPNLNGVTVLLSKEDQINATVIAYDAVKDLAILELEQDLYKRPPVVLADSKKVKASDEVFALGFPGDADLIDDTPSGEPEDVSITRGIISKISAQGGRDIFQVDVNINPGNSGGPLVNEDGAVIGINTFGVTTASGINGAVQIHEVIPMLESRGIEYLTADEALPVKEPEKGAEPMEEEGVSIVFIVAAAAGVFMLLLALVVIIIAVLRKREKPPVRQRAKAAESFTQPAPVQKVPRSSERIAGKPVIRGISGYFQGQSAELENVLIIGRDPHHCQLVYPSSNEEISRKHCSVRFDSATMTFLVEDFSSNGTFMHIGERLAKGRIYQLKAGERFYLSSPKNMFEVNLEK